MATTFAAQMAQFRDKTREQMKAVLQRSVQDVLEEALRSESLGGRLPVKTGFLRNSLVSELNGTTSWPVTHPPKDGSAGGGSPHYLLTVAEMEPGDIARFAFTAAYAARMEYGFVGEDSKGRTYNQQGRHFVEGAAAQWPAIVARNIGKLK